MQTFKSFLGKPFFVTDEGYATNVTAFPGIEKMDYGQLMGTIRGLHQKEAARLSAVRFGTLAPGSVILSDHERALISACDWVINMNARFIALGGRDLAQTYGEQVAIDTVNLTNWKPDTCGCEHQFLWRLDHGAAGQPERVHHAHAAVKRCDEHAHLTAHADHYAEILAKNQHKNHTVNTVGEVLGVHPGEVEWHYGEDRVLAVSHPAIAAISDQVTKALADHPAASKRPVRLG